MSHVNQNKTSPFEMDRINTFQKLPKAKPILPNGKESERVINLRKDGVSDFIEPQIFLEQLSWDDQVTWMPRVGNNQKPRSSPDF